MRLRLGTLIIAQAMVIGALAATVSGIAVWAAAGDLDPTFSGDGKVAVSFFAEPDASAVAHAIAVQPDGKIVTAGTASRTQFPQPSANTSEFAVARLNANGTLDTTFSGDGRVTTNLFGGNDYVYDVAVQGDAKIVAVGTANADAATWFTVAVLVRYTAAGALDTSFGTGGIVTTDFVGGGTNSANSVVLQPDGKIVIAGSAIDSANVSAGFALARYNSNGTLDTSFGTGGKVLTSFYGFSDRALDIALQPDGKLVAVGSAYPGGANDQFAVARYHANGTLDSSFGSGGKVVTDFFGANDTAHSVVLHAGGKIVAAGLAYPANQGIDHFALARYNADGSLDATFGIGGKTSTEFSSAWARSAAAAGQADGKVVMTSWGVDPVSGFDHFLLARFDVNGALDPSFSGDGKVTTSINGSQNQAYDVAVHTDGRVVVAGSAWDPVGVMGTLAVARFDASGGTSSASLASISVTPTSVVGGSPATGTVTLNSPAGSGGTVVTLSDNSSATTIPASVTVAAGATGATFSITTASVPLTTTATITGSAGGVSHVTGLTLTSATPVAPVLSAPANATTVAQPVAFDWTDVFVAVDYEIQIDDSSTIAAPYRASQIVTTSQASIGNLPAQQLWWRVRARNAAGVFGPYSATRRFTAQSATAVVSLTSVAVAPGNVVGGQQATGTVTLSAAAPAGNAVVSLSSSSASVGVPASVTVPAGATSASFSVTTTSVTASTSATISATYGGVTRTSTLIVGPPGSTATLTVTATGRSGQRITSSPAGINVTVGSTQSAGFATNTSITLSVAGGRQAVWSGACSSGGARTTSCTFVISANASVTANVN